MQWIKTKKKEGKMNTNAKIAKELVRLAKRLVAADENDFSEERAKILRKCVQNNYSAIFEDDGDIYSAILTDNLYNDEFTIQMKIENGSKTYGIEGDGIGQEYNVDTAKYTNIDKVLSLIFDEK